MRTIALTGATGMIGCAVVRQAIKNGDKVICFVRKDSANLDRLPHDKNVIIYFSDLDGLKNIQCKETADCFFHLGWAKTTVNGRDDYQVQAQNIGYTIDAVMLAKRLGCRSFVGAGSQAECGLVDKPISINTPANPESGYGIAKSSACSFARAMCKQYGMKFNWTRILSVYGKYDNPNSFISYCINMMKYNKKLEVTQCEQIWDYIYCDDAADALLAISEKGKNGCLYPIGGGYGKQLRNYLLEIKEELNSTSEIIWGSKNYYPHQPMVLVADITELQNDCGFKPTIGFRQGIAKIIS